MPARSAGRPVRPPAAPRSPQLSHSQNFITDASLVQRLLGRVELGPASTIVEIGPGRGMLTAGLLRLAPRVLAVEADTGFVRELLLRFNGCPGLTLVHGDFLDYPLPACPFVVVANIPFNRTAEIVRKLTGEEPGLTSAYLIMQKEAAGKFAGAPGCASPLLSHLLKLRFTVDCLCDIPRACFTPRPSVDAAFARFRKRKVPLLAGQDALCFQDLLCALFGCSRPLLRDALRALLGRRQVDQCFQALRLNGSQRLSTLAFDEWLAVFHAFDEHSSAEARSRIKGAYAKLLAEQAGLQKVHRTRRDPG